MTCCRCLSPGEGYGRCPGPESCPLCQPEDDFDPAEAAALIPLAWLESMADAARSDDEAPVDLGFVPMVNTGPLADSLRDRIAECQDTHWLLVLAATHPNWAEPAMRQLAAMCKDSPTWANWLQHCQDEHDTRLATEAENHQLERGEAMDAQREFERDIA